jgi:hypothetical protein
MPEVAPYTCAQQQDRIALRTQCEVLCYRLLQGVRGLDALPISTENNQTFAALRDMLSDLVQHIQDCTPISQGETDASVIPPSR